jgi:hypothetical protein
MRLFVVVLWSSVGGQGSRQTIILGIEPGRVLLLASRR